MMGKKLWPHQQAVIDALMKGGGFMRSVFGPHPVYHTGGVIEQNPGRVYRQQGESRLSVTSSMRASRPRTDDMIQMLADFERHGYGRKPRIVIVVIDHLSHGLEKAQARIALKRKEKT